MLLAELLFVLQLQSTHLIAVVLAGNALDPADNRAGGYRGPGEKAVAMNGALRNVGGHAIVQCYFPRVKGIILQST